MRLQRVGECDDEGDGDARDSNERAARVCRENVGGDDRPKSDVARDGDEQVDGEGTEDGGEDDEAGASARGLVELVGD